MTVSVIIAVHNGAWCIERAIDSLLVQTLPPSEIIVCDDGSTDGTPELVETRFGSRVIVLRMPRRNASATRADGLMRARGEWLAFMDADDTWRQDKLERQLDYLRAHPEVQHISSDGTLVSNEGVVRSSWLSDYFNPVRELHGDLYRLLLERCFVLMSSTMVHRDAYHAVGGMDPKIVYSHDYDLWLRMYARFPAAVMAEPLISYFTSPNALSRNYEARHRDDLDLMRAAERGEHRRDPSLQRRAGERAAALEYKIGVLCMRTGRDAEGRMRLRRAAARGSLPRRALARAGSFGPGWAARALKRSSWLKRRVGGAAETPTRVRLDGGQGDPA
jgi:glycosyltransferase involved in cell wall biosynthesis